MKSENALYREKSMLVQQMKKRKKQRKIFVTTTYSLCPSVCAGPRSAIISTQMLGTALTRPSKPFGLTLEIADRRPHESLRNHLKMVSFHEHYMGYAYIAVGEKGEG